MVAAAAAQVPRPRVEALVVPVCAAGLAVAAAAALAFATSARSATALTGVAALLAGSLLADRFPVPLDGVEANGVSVAFVFGVAGIVLFGWAAGALVLFATPAIVNVLERRPPIRTAYNAATLALAGAAAGWAAAPFGDESSALFARVAAAVYVAYLVNIVLITAVIALSARRAWPRLLYETLLATVVPFTLMGSIVLMLVVLWQRSPFLCFALAGPLLAIQLYQRALTQSLRAVRLALTDPVTGLGNHRRFHERLERELAAAQPSRPLALCLVDVDDFKRINDRYGHPAGDRVLADLAAKLRQSGEAFRLGGDEFAVVMTRCDAGTALAAAESIVTRIAAFELAHVGRVTVSAGVAAAPAHASDRDELMRLADSALYWAKEYGKNRAHVYRPDVLELAELKRLANAADRAARYRAAVSLASAVDDRDAYTGSHSERVAELAARVATRLGLRAEEVELTRLAASLHDLGKLAIPEELLWKPGPLTAPERVVLERHPQIGFRMLDSLAIEPVALAVLHHHERWDGTGYPDGLAADAIPLGSRIIFVADAYDAMTSDRVYRPRLAPDEALAELCRCAGTQFDPEIVATFAAEVDEPVAAAV